MTSDAASSAATGHSAFTRPPPKPRKPGSLARSDDAAGARERFETTASFVSEDRNAAATMRSCNARSRASLARGARSRRESSASASASNRFAPSSSPMKLANRSRSRAGQRVRSAPQTSNRRSSACLSSTRLSFTIAQSLLLKIRISLSPTAARRRRADRAIRRARRPSDFFVRGRAAIPLPRPKSP